MLRRIKSLIKRFLNKVLDFKNTDWKDLIKTIMKEALVTVATISLTFITMKAFGFEVSSF